MKVLILGGSGFIGFNLKSHFNKHGIVTDSYSSKTLNISDQEALEKAVKGYDAIVNLVGLSGVTATQDNPQDTIRVNTIGQLNLLEACRKNNPDAKIIFLSSRLEYGKTTKLPIDKKAPLRPNTIYGISKYMATKYGLLYNKLYGLKTVTLRVGNPYGPQPGIPKPKYNIINYFIYTVLKGGDINIFGKGNQKRDYIFVSDLCEAIHQSITKDGASGKILNIGGGTPASLSYMAEKIIKIAGRGKVIYKKWPEDWSAFETGDSYFDLSETQKILDWAPKTNIDKGLTETVNYFKNL